MIRVGFFLNFPVEYKGGINYYKNLFFAIKKYHSSEIQIILFIPPSLPESIVKIFAPYVILVKTMTIERKTLPWLISVAFNRILKFDYLTYLLLKKNKVDVVSYSLCYMYTGKLVKSVNWIPDFQSLHYPQFWTKKQLRQERCIQEACIRKSDLIVLSSYDALNDYTSLFPDKTAKARVIHFVSQPEILSIKNDMNLEQYADRPFFYLPNQFWEHKNHIIVFKAVKILKEKGMDVLLLNSGLMKDYRSSDRHISQLLKFVAENQLEKYIKFLGLIPYSDVFGLIKNSVAVINPSYFEGWSSTVEEAKSINKTILLSDIPVHREQNPESGIFFKPDDEHELARLMEEILKHPVESGDESLLKEALERRTKEFGSKYKRLLEELT